jgi:hypothetical protein
LEAEVQTLAPDLFDVSVPVGPQVRDTYIQIQREKDRQRKRHNLRMSYTSPYLLPLRL